MKSVSCHARAGWHPEVAVRMDASLRWHDKPQDRLWRSHVVAFGIAALLTFSATLPTHAAPTSTQRFIVALADAFENKVIGDDELVALIVSADAGLVANPIHEATAEYSAERFLAYEVFKGYVDGGDLAAPVVADWARENLVENERGRKARDESREETTLPWKIEPERTFSIGEEHGCAIELKGQPVCWGRVRYPFPEGVGPLTHIGVDNSGNGCAIKEDGTMVCTGIASHEVPENLNTVRSVSPGSVSRGCALMKNGKVKCWGTTTKMPELENLGAAESVVMDRWLACAVKKDGLVACWSMRDGEITPVTPGDLGPVRFLSVGSERACAVNANGFVICWGKNFLNSNDVPKDLGEVLSVSCGSGHTCAVKVDHTVACWGYKTNQKLAVPAGLAGVESVFASDGFTCAVKLDGTVVCWGESRFGSQAHIPPPGLIVKSSRSKP